MTDCLKPKMGIGYKSLLRFGQRWWAALLVVAIHLLATAQAMAVTEAANTASPRDTLRSFIEASNAAYDLIVKEKYLDPKAPVHARTVEQMVDCVDISGFPAFARGHRSAEVAICIKEILDRQELPEWQDIPDDAAMQQLQENGEPLQWRVPGTRITITRIEEGLQKHEYLFSEGTADRAVSSFHNVEDEPYRTGGPPVSRGFYRWYVTVPGNPVLGEMVQELPEFLRTERTLGMANWKWLGILITFLVSALVMGIALWLQWKLAARFNASSMTIYTLTMIFPVIALLVPILALHFSEGFLTIRGTPLYVISFLANLIAIFAGINVIFAFTNRIAESIIATPKINPLGLNAQLIRISAKLISLFATVILFICGGHFLGIPVGTLFASAGIVGAAVALAAQDTLKNLLGTIVLFGDKPFQVGERIKLPDHDGFVEDIGLRSTRIRLLNGNLVTVPNSHLAGTDIENVSSRPSIRRDGILLIPLDTPADKIEKAVAIVRKAVDQTETLDPKTPPRVYFADFDSIAFKITFVYWFNPADYWASQECAERINFQIFHAFEKEGIQFSLPLRHTFWKDDDAKGPLDVRMIDESDQ